MAKIEQKERTAIINSLKAGVVPRVGLQHIKAGRKQEIEEFTSDLNEIKEGTSKLRFIIGDFGSGKSFLLTQACITAAENNFVSTKVDISTEKVLYSRDKKALGFYCELIKNLTVGGGAQSGVLRQIIETWLEKHTGLQEEVSDEVLYNKLKGIKESVNGYDFSHIIHTYCKAYYAGKSRVMDNCLRWLSGEYLSRTEARNDLKVSSCITDENYYDNLKLLSRFIKEAGYGGLLICIDELAVLTRLPGQARTQNYETILKMYNDCLQGNQPGIYYLFGGTPEFLRHPSKGLYSYGALKTRLNECKSHFAGRHSRDLSGPVIELKSVPPEDLYGIFITIRDVFARYEPSSFLLNNEGIGEVVKRFLKPLGAPAFLSPREAIKKYVYLLSQLEQSPGKSWRDFFETKNKQKDEGAVKNWPALTKLRGLKL